MKAKEIRAMSQDEMKRKVEELTQELFNLRFRQGIAPLENPKRIMKCRRDIARINTIMNEIRLEIKR